MLERERAVRTLRKIVSLQSDQLHRAFSAIEHRTAAAVAERHEIARKNLVRKLGLLEVAKELVVNCEAMRLRVGSKLIPGALPEGVDWFAVRKARQLRAWEQKTLDTTGALYDTDGRYMREFAGHILTARKLGFDVGSQAAVKSYAFALHRVWSQGKIAYDVFLQEHDPHTVRDQSATSLQLMIVRWCDLLESAKRQTLSHKDWWELSALLLLALDEGFVSTSNGAAHDYPWRLPEPSEDLLNGRHTMVTWAKLYIGSAEERDRLITDCLVRCAEHLGEGGYDSLVVPEETRSVHQVGPKADGKALGFPISTIHILRSGCKIRWNGGEEMFFPPKQGFKYLALLIQNQGKRIDACAMEAPRPGEAPESYSVQEVMDAEAFQSIRRAAIDLERRASEARELGDEESAGKIEAEADRLLRERRRATRQGGSSRLAGSPESLKRDRIRKRIAAAISAVRDQSEGLHAHLMESIQDPSGTSPGYFPKTPVDWLVEYAV